MRTVRRAVTCAAAAAGLIAIAGCNTSSLSKQEIVVYFYSNAPASDHQAALTACGHVAPEVAPEPLDTSSLYSDQIGDVRFRVDHADDRDLALLTECLNKQPGVEGVDTPDLTD